MFETLRSTLTSWNRNNSDKQKLQHAHISLLLFTVFVAGLVSLFSAERSRQLMFVSLALITTLAVNFLVWALLKSSVLDKLPRTTTTPATRRTTTRQTRR